VLKNRMLAGKRLSQPGCINNFIGLILALD
jgi:hypothetical protein